MGKQSLPRNWQNVIWREWRNCQDQEYAKHLLDLVVDEPAGWWAVATLMLLGVLYGAMGGLLAGLIATNWEVRTQPEMWQLMWPILLDFTWKGGILGGIVGVLAGTVWGRWLPWRTWLAMFTPDLPHRQPDEELVIGLVAGLGGRVTVVLIGVLIGVLVDVLVGVPLGGGLVLGLVLVMALGLALVMVGVMVVGVVDGLDGRLGCGLGFGLVVGLVFGPFFVLVGGLVVVLVVGLGVGLGAVLDNDLGSISKVTYTHENRSWWLWWRKRPYARKLEVVLGHIAQVRPAIQQVWAEPMRRLDALRQQSDAPDARISSLQGGNWVDRFTARHALVTLGGEAVEFLQVLAQGNDEPQRRTATWLLKSIAQDTTARLKRQAARLLCPRCTVRFGAHRVRLSWRISTTYYGCRACGQSRKFLDWPGEIVAVLDTGMTEGQV